MDAGKPYQEGGWGWVVAFTCFVVNCICYGTIKSFGVLLPAMAEGLDMDLWIIGSVNSVHVGAQFIVAPFAAAVGRKIGLRYVIMFGGVLYGLGLILASMTGNVTTAICIVIAGFGAGCVRKPIQASLVYFFQTKYDVACFISALGDPIGMIGYGPTSLLLLETYGWQGTMLLLGGVGCHLIVCGLLVRKPSEGYAGVSNEENVSPQTSTNSADVGKYSSRLFAGLTTFCKSTASFLGLEIFLNVQFILLTVSKNFLFISYTGIIVYMVPNGLSRGLSSSEAAALTTAWGVGSLVGYTLPIITVHTKLLSNHATAGFGLITAACFALNPFISSFVGQMVNTAFMAAGLCCICQVIAVLTRNMPVSDDQFISVFCWQSSLTGVSATFGGVISGWLYDATDSFQATFFWLSGTTVASFLCIVLHFIYVSKKRPTSQ